MLAASYVVDKFSLLWPLLAAPCATVIVGVFLGWIHLSGSPSQGQRHAMVVIGLVVLVGCEAGLPIANASQKNDQVKHESLRAQMFRDLKVEHLRVFGLDEYSKTVTLSIGNHGCQIDAVLVHAKAVGWADFRTLWRPALPGVTTGNLSPGGKSDISVITARDLTSLANGSCSS